jgi:hypothetical protein
MTKVGRALKPALVSAPREARSPHKQSSKRVPNKKHLGAIAISRKRSRSQKKKKLLTSPPSTLHLALLLR